MRNPHFFGSLVLFIAILALKKSPKPTYIRQTLLPGLLRTTSFVGLIIRALAIILTKKLHQRVPRIDLLSFTTWQMLLGSLPLVALTLVIPSKPVEWSDTLIAAALFNVILANGFG